MYLIVSRIQVYINLFKTLKKMSSIQAPVANLKGFETEANDPNSLSQIPLGSKDQGNEFFASAYNPIITTMDPTQDEIIGQNIVGSQVLWNSFQLLEDGFNAQVPVQLLPYTVKQKLLKMSLPSQVALPENKFPFRKKNAICFV